ncbi:cytomegalovirus gH-receptor family protein [Zymoseptoria brevis]|uniref:Cytomegalovirus gH-receptor family protein n=1 Tax=Zymoseptoria brevis TaxID=1047168 RepID=A0A0F4GWW3_9PEZI|nr:cytomegalovirus gH-receptor family protein [Zymoseptoria brevis]
MSPSPSPSIERALENKDVKEQNGQLITPALSPISEHGNGSQTFPLLSADRDVPDLNREQVTSKARQDNGNERERDRRRSSETRALKLSGTQIHELTTSPESLPLRPLDELRGLDDAILDPDDNAGSLTLDAPFEPNRSHPPSPFLDSEPSLTATPSTIIRPRASARSNSTPVEQQTRSSLKSSKGKPQLPPLRIDDDKTRRPSGPFKPSPGHPSPMPSMLPIPPLSLPTYLHLELSSDRPSALYIHRSRNADYTYESSRIKFERLLNFLLLPPSLEQVLCFGTIACLDAWLYTFTILPLRFLKAVVIFARWAGMAMAQEVRDLASFVYSGVGRIWQRQRITPGSSSWHLSDHTVAEHKRPTADTHAGSSGKPGHVSVVPPSPTIKKQRSGFRHRRRNQSSPSGLLPNHKADLLQGLLIICSCAILMWFDASRMYHSIRGQAAIKLYVIYNVIEVFDRLLSAIGQDILECLFSKETLERDTDGRSKVLRPLGMFVVALIYNVVHATAFFYQVVTLNVAVNSYSNALLTLLMSNQFVEIKGTVFKKFEKENLFQITCADVVERFQLWLMLLIIALRNIVEVGGLSISITSALGGGGGSPTDAFSSNGTGIPLVSGFVIPKAFTIFPKWTGEVLGPFLIVLGSEALVDWCKHAYINKFNNIKPNIYGRFLDVLAKDYYSHAFSDQNLTKRLGLPVLPLSCLFIRACMQTYHMFLATHMPVPIPSAGTSIAEPPASTPVTTAALQHIDQVFRRALGRSSFGAGNSGGPSLIASWNIDDFIALATMVIVFLAVYLIMLALKLVLGMALLSYARGRYNGMKERERESVDTHGRRVGGWGTVEVNEDKRRWMYEDDPEGLKNLRKKESEAQARAASNEMKLDHVDRYVMASKRIW